MPEEDQKQFIRVIRMSSCRYWIGAPFSKSYSVV